MIDSIEKKTKKLIEIGYSNRDGETIYYADKDSRDNIKELKKSVLNLNTEQATLITQMDMLKDQIKNLHNDITVTSDHVPKNLNKITNEIKSDQINMNAKDIYIYADDNSTPSKVSVIELGKIQKQLIPLVRTVNEMKREELDILKESLDAGDYIYNFYKNEERNN